MVVEVTQGVRHLVRFDFALATDTPVAIARELREAGLVWIGITENDLVELVQASLQERLKEVASERRLQASSSAASPGSSAALPCTRAPTTQVT